MNRKLRVLILCFILIAVSFAGCGYKQTTAIEGKKSSSLVKDSVIISMSADMGTFDPLNSGSASDMYMYLNIYDYLADYDGITGKFSPMLAEKWAMADDGLSWTFSLRKGVKFHNGEVFNADDVIYTITKAQKSPYLANAIVAIKNMEKVDDNTVKINLKFKYAPFLLNICTIPILEDKAYAADPKGYGQQPIGTGPYKFVNHYVGQRVVLERNDGYWGGKAPIKNVEFKIITDPITSVIALQSGDVDMCYTVPASSLEAIQNDSKLKTFNYDSSTVVVGLMNCSKKPFNNLLVRQAINYAIDKDSIIKMAESGMGTKAQSILNKFTFGYSENIKGYELNVEKAKQLLSQAGYPNGFSVKFKTLDGSLKKVAEVLQGSLSQIGINLQIEMCEKNAYLKDLATGNYEMGDIGITLPQDADSWSLIFETKGGFNISHYSNTRVDQLFKQGRENSDKQQRLSIYKDLLQTLNDDAVVAPIYFNVKPMAAKKELVLGRITPDGATKVFAMSWSK